MIKKIQLKKDKEAQSILDAFFFGVMAFIIIVFLALMGWGIVQISNQIRSVELPDNPLNITMKAGNDVAFGNLSAGMDVLKVVGFCMVFGMILTILISNFLVKAHPVFLAGYVAVGIIAIIFSFIMSNAYSDMVKDTTFGTILKQDTAGTFIMLNLPIFIIVITFLGGIFLFSGIMSDRGQGGGLG